MTDIVWISAVAAAYESADILGIDIAPVQYATESNCRFEIDNINAEWTREWDYFHLIYGHNLLGNVDDWPRLCRNAFRSLTAGGCFELRDRPFRYTGEGEPNGSWNRVSQEVDVLGGLVGYSFSITPGMYTRYMENAGFRDIHETWTTIPVVACLDVILDQIECLLFLKWHRESVDSEEARMRMAALRSQLESEAGGVTTQCVTVWGRKPSSRQSSPASGHPNSAAGEDDEDGLTDQGGREELSTHTSKRGYDDGSVDITPTTA
ncbi:hypothetical protein NKR23_g12182 [Pleurostoma richardsiae]|uniref:Methyltransferase domain-containing protein n=1 Tax=Pleurostoma richardsiae TaxID=41990 RepID=A0AA38VGC8_9PEZI|nr:hypothetical protein NKR23_g12182 [Pleurostoma richardsiae]